MLAAPCKPMRWWDQFVWANRAAAEGVICPVLGRWVVAGATWFAAGRALWLLPNMLSEVRAWGRPGTSARVLQPPRLAACMHCAARCRSRLRAQWHGTTPALCHDSELGGAVTLLCSRDRQLQATQHECRCRM